ncbi:PREDICTED: BTB/POZ domain-containing protein At3g56230 [Tarenaya hassleriana]|uniref:BTB/POZ domain-containing protein At3g56230 n=1 Tax=Tarenaya hassleriana TaxID=28532 RepID=UPI00053C614B|nr:PREDICTED: BTB/POZ domain-containing protein At3g56230 [Tarenaya hassleriana]
MDCSICTKMPAILRPPRNTICGSCYEGARSIIMLLNKLENSNEDVKPIDKSNLNYGPSLSSPLISCEPQPLGNVIKWMKRMKETEEGLNKKIRFLSNFSSAFQQQLHTDIPAHRALLASRSEIFKNILDSDPCKTAPEDSITLQELNSEELQTLLEFLYNGTLPQDKLQKHVYALFIAADKYMIPYLQEFCEQHMLWSLDISNVLDVLSVSDLCLNKRLKETALGFVVKNMDDVVFSAKYEAFSHKNNHLCVQITRAFLMDTKNKRCNQ